MFCINVIVRKRWIEHEEAELPDNSTPTPDDGDATASILSESDDVAWIRHRGNASTAEWAAPLSSPLSPGLRTRIQSFQFFTDEPWNAMDEFRLSFYPFAIGLGFFIPLDLSFSCWFFLLVLAVDARCRCRDGFTKPTRFPYMNEQASGGYIALAVIALWRVEST